MSENRETTSTTESKSNATLVFQGMLYLSDLYQGEDEVKAKTIGHLLIGDIDDEIKAAFTHVHGEEAGALMLDQIKDAFRELLQYAIDKETERQEDERCEKFMGNHEPHELGTVAELSEEFGVSKKHIRRLKQQGRLEEFVNERRK